MPPEVWFYELIRLAGIVSLGAFAALGMKLWLEHRDRRANRISLDDFERLAEAIDNLQEETAIIREELQELHERVDFAERMLSDAGRSRRLLEPADTPV
jgi:hypothetical protein